MHRHSESSNFNLEANGVVVFSWKPGNTGFINFIFGKYGILQVGGDEDQDDQYEKNALKLQIVSSCWMLLFQFKVCPWSVGGAKNHLNDVTSKNKEASNIDILSKIGGWPGIPIDTV